MTRRLPALARRAVLPAGLLSWLLLASQVAALESQPPRFTREQMEAAIADSPPFRFVYGTRDPAATPLLRARALALARRAFGLDSTRVVADRDADERMIAAGPVYLLGGSAENEWTRRLAEALPVRFEERGFRWQGRLYDQPLDAIHLSWPNPLEPRRFLLLSAGNSPEALSRRGGFAFGDEDWRVVRGGELVRTGTFAHDGGRPWRYDPARDRDREAERERYTRSLRPLAGEGVVVRAPEGLGGADAVRAGAAALLERLARNGLPAPAGGAAVSLTLYRSLEDKGTFTRDTHAEHLVTEDREVVAHAALPFGRDALDLWSVAAARLTQRGASASSRFLRPAATHFTERFEGESLARSVARLYFGGRLPAPAQAASRDGAWRSPLVWVPTRALLVRAVWESAPAPARRGALAVLLRADAPGTLDSLCRSAGVSARLVEGRYRALADSLARTGRVAAARARREPWRPAEGFQRGVCLAHAVGLERGYLSRECVRQIARVREAGADWVSLTPFAWLADPAIPELGNSADSGPDGESDEAVCEAAARAHAAGLRVWLAPHVWTRGWAGELAFSPSGWRRFFDNYEQVLLHWSLLAEREGLDGLFVGHELASSTTADPARWRALIGGVRRVYGGLLTYAANWDEAARVPFWDALDLVGVSFYSPLAEKPTRDPRVLRRGAERALDALEPLARRHGRPVLLVELGYAPSADAPVRPWEEPRATDDPEAQRACWEAAVAAMEPREWLAGAFAWKWGTTARATDPFDPRGRPAESVVTRALQSWQGRPVRVTRAEPPTPERRQPKGRR